VVTSAGLPLREEGAFFVDLRVLRAFVVRSCCLLVLSGCRSDGQSITEKEWVVVAIGDLQGPVGSGGQLLTMNFDAQTSQVSGFSGCNQYNAPYRLHGDSLSFGPVVSTKMACLLPPDTIEPRFLAALPAVRALALPDSILTLVGSGGVAVKLRQRQH